jgi:hypothetical protein
MVLIITGAKAQQESTSANYQLPACKAFLEPYPKTRARPDLDQGFCVGMVTGIVFMAQDSGVANACTHIPDAVTIGQKVRVVVQFIESWKDIEPNRLHEPFMRLALDALANAWPCHRN